MESWCGVMCGSLRRLRGERRVSQASSSSSVEEDFSFAVEARPRTQRHSASDQEVDPQLKQSILKNSPTDGHLRHAFAPDSEGVVHKPKLIAKPAEAESKVRYLNGQVVSTKGGRFMEEKKELTEEMKKTYISLKPAKQYRFH